MTSRDGAFRQGTLRTGRKLQEPERIGHGRTTLAHPGRHLLVGQAEFVDELL